MVFCFRNKDLGWSCWEFKSSMRSPDGNQFDSLPLASSLWHGRCSEARLQNPDMWIEWFQKQSPRNAWRLLRASKHGQIKRKGARTTFQTTISICETYFGLVWSFRDQNYIICSGESCIWYLKRLWEFLKHFHFLSFLSSLVCFLFMFWKSFPF